METKANRPRFPRKDPESDHEFAERVLFEEMERAAELLHSEQDYARAGLRCALRACHDYLHVRGLSGQGLKVLADALAALDTLDRGTLPEVFDPKMRPGTELARKWSRSAAAQETKIYAAACMEALIKAGASKDEAAAKVAENARNWPRISKGFIKPSTVANWRDELMQQQSHDRDRSMYERHSQNFSDGPRAREYLKEVLRDGPSMTGGIRKSKT